MRLNILQYGKSYSSEWQIPEMFLEVHLIFTKLFSNPRKIKNENGNMAESTRGGANHDHFIIQLIFWG
jgi:hypothetical protein